MELLREIILKDILSHGLFVDERGNLYGEQYKDYLNNNGIWQIPEELVELILFFKNKKINSFLNIGTFNGHTFNLIAKYLNMFNKTQCITIDFYNWNPAKNKDYAYLQATSEDFKNQKFDLVMIDGDHTYEWVKKDYENLGKYAKYCVFHDINDKFIADLPHGGVLGVWHQLKAKHKTIEIIKSDKRVMGIGILINVFDKLFI